MSILKELKEMITARGGSAGSANTVAQAVDVLTDLGGGGNVVVTVDVIHDESGNEQCACDRSLNNIFEAWNSHKTIWCDIVTHQPGDILEKATYTVTFVDNGEDKAVTLSPSGFAYNESQGDRLQYVDFLVLLFDQSSTLTSIEYIEIDHHVILDGG